MSGIISIASGSEDDLQSAVANVGPIAVAVDASSNAFRVYAVCMCVRGFGQMCSTTIISTTNLHAVLFRWCLQFLEMF